MSARRTITLTLQARDDIADILDYSAERFGAPAVAAHVAAQLGLTHQFIDIDNPA